MIVSSEIVKNKVLDGVEHLFGWEVKFDDLPGIFLTLGSVDSEIRSKSRKQIRNTSMNADIPILYFRLFSLPGELDCSKLGSQWTRKNYSITEYITFKKNVNCDWELKGMSDYYDPTLWSYDLDWSNEKKEAYLQQMNSLAPNEQKFFDDIVAGWHSQLFSFCADPLRHLESESNHVDRMMKETEELQKRRMQRKIDLDTRIKELGG